MREVHTTDRSWLAWARVYLHVFRVVVVSACAIIAAYAWLADLGWLLAASACIGTGELLECSYYLTVLRWGERSRRLSSRRGSSQAS
jgi:ABC-type transport system involved in cytochrome bd biosynthesis fused ATPase/permease subunit